MTYVVTKVITVGRADKHLLINVSHDGNPHLYNLNMTPVASVPAYLQATVETKTLKLPQLCHPHV